GTDGQLRAIGIHIEGIDLPRAIAALSVLGEVEGLDAGPAGSGGYPNADAVGANGIHFQIAQRQPDLMERARAAQGIVGGLADGLAPVEVLTEPDGAGLLAQRRSVDG